MADDEPDSGQVEDRTDEKLTPQDAYTLTEENGIPNKAVAEMYDVSPSWVSQQKNAYEEARNEGRQSVSPNDFEPEELEEALSDEETENPYENSCPLCNAVIPAPDTAGIHECLECGEPIEWDESEI